MRSAAVFALMLLSLAGCGGKAAGGVDVGFITPGVWAVGGSTDRLLFWAHNLATEGRTVEWRITLADSSVLPEGLAVNFSSASASLEPKGTKVAQGGGRFNYPDWSWTLATLTVAPGTAAGTHAIRVHAGEHSATGELRLEADRANTTGPGSKVKVEYAGKFTASGEAFDDGSFDTTLGSGQTVTGFDYGLMGLRQGESATIVIPAALAYGYDNSHPSYTRFNGQSLTFDVKILTML